NRAEDLPVVDIYIGKSWGMIEGNEKPANSDVRFKIYGNSDLIKEVTLPERGYIDNLQFQGYDQNGEEIHYSITEVIDGDWDISEKIHFEETYKDNASMFFEIMNRQQKEETIKIPVEKIWKGKEGQSASFTLYADNKEIADA